MRSVYVIGAAGSGKSTFMAELLSDVELLPQKDFYSQRNAKALVTLRGHRMRYLDGIYLGCMREAFPGTDGLDRASSPVGAAWLRDPIIKHPAFLVGEGATLATRPFLEALYEKTDMLLVLLEADEVVLDLRFLQRGSNQNASFVKSTASRSESLFKDMASAGANCTRVNSSNKEEWDAALDACSTHLVGG